MAKEKLKKDKKLKKSKASSERKKEKKKKSKKPKEPKDCRHDQSDTNEQASREGVEQLQMGTVEKCNASGDEERNKPIPIKLSVTSASNDSTCGGLSWGTAFAAASKVQPNDTDLDRNFLGIVAAASDGGSTKGFMDISQLVNDHKMKTKSSNDATKIAYSSSEGKLKRRPPESSLGSNDDESESSNSDLSLEGRMVPNHPIDGNINNMSLVLVDKQSGKVYSSGERARDGRRLVIGKTVKGNVELDPSAVEEMKRLEEGDSSSPRQDSVQDKARPTTGPSFPFPTIADDHCETGLESYKDILPILDELCKSFGGVKHSMKIYDPYFCNGSVIKHLSSLGFSRVYNRKEDCYGVWKSKSEPLFDVFLTNPPYSEDHIEKLMKYVTSSSFGNKPWLLLMPQWVHKKDYYINATTKNCTNPRQPFYIVPKRRYVYLPPANFREKKESDTHKKSSPFVSMWFCWGGNEKVNEGLINAFQRSTAIGDCDVARSKSALRDLRRGCGSKGGKKKKARTGK